MDSSGKPKVKLSSREAELLVGAWLSLKNSQIDYDNFAAFLGLQKAKSARNAFGTLKKRLREEFGDGVGGRVTARAAVSKNTTAKASTAKKKASETLRDATDDDVFDANPFQPPAKKAKQDNYGPGHFELKEAYYFEDGRI
ncbi:uncharacterized protein PpBr36_10883 [Pyricularia pennisetigena]|uniref:uncharacterized protein n=1 Tax=Pyricularia pennisetigena TaxID=1578925 RepID=UPI00114F0EC9|nr:uncharacterized protein PpBr36_10883 [Pyricularia pennisetigena]TLS20970.1 hypothetical protein PpBr36_10883 [Pyricularia pennisetigena]